MFVCLGQIQENMQTKRVYVEKQQKSKDNGELFNPL